MLFEFIFLSDYFIRFQVVHLKIRDVTAHCDTNWKHVTPTLTYSRTCEGTSPKDFKVPERVQMTK